MPAFESTVAVVACSSRTDALSPQKRRERHVQPIALH